MTATDELRRLLDERGIEYTTLSYSDTTWWTDTNGLDWCYEENCVSTHLTCCSLRITPAQAIAATLGAGTCHEVEDEDTGFIVCSECGAVHDKDYTSYYCWCCGRRIEVDE